MPAPAFKRVEQLFHRAAALPAAERPGFLAEACAGDAELRAAVEDLLRHDAAHTGTDDFLVSPVATEAEELRSERPTVLDVGQGNTIGATEPLPSVPGYEILGERGRGGMGVVYKAHRIGLNRLVALKMLLPEAAATPELLVRFRREAEALARLRHPNVITIYDVGECGGRPYFTMEYVAGPNLAEWLAGRPQDPAASACLVEVLARAMHAVHQAGIVHRDLKPANILIQEEETTNKTNNTNKEEEEGDRRPTVPADSASDSSLIRPIRSIRGSSLKITDFGLARDDAGGPRLTKSGVAMGTPCYMAPELARPRAGRTGPATDIYALGAILYEMLTGRPPFEGETPSETIVQVIHDEPLSPKRLRPGLPRDLVTICLKCLEKQPHRRYATALDLAEDLRRFQACEPIQARPVGLVERSYRWCRRRPLVAALLALCALLGFAFVVTVVVYEIQLREAWARAEKKAELEEALAEGERREIIQLHVQMGVAALEADYSFAALFSFTEALRLDGPAADRNHRTRIGTTLRQCPQLLGHWDLKGGPVLPRPPLWGALRPDARVLAAVNAAGTVQVVDLTSGASRTQALAPGGEAYRVGFRPDGHLLAVRYAGGIVRSWDITGGQAVPVRGLAVAGATFAALSSDGRWLFTADAGGKAEVRDVRTGKTTATPLQVERGAKLGDVSADGRRLALAGPDGVLRFWDLATGKPVGKVFALSPDVCQVVLGPDGRLVLLEGTDEARVWDAVTGRARTSLLGRGGGATLAAFHADGARFLIVGADGSARLWKLPPGPEVIHSSPSGGELLAEHPATSPDGRWAAVCEDRLTVRVRDAATGTPRTPPLRHRSAVLYAAFSPDGTRLLTASDHRVARVWDAETGEVLAPPLRHDLAIRRVFFSPDGNRACVVHEGGAVSSWDLTPDQRPVEELLKLARELTGER
jgi:serine/threonine protein kinase/WD40 repeat protein